MSKIVSPLGEPTVEVGAASPRLPDLAGKTICEVWNGAYKGEIMFPILRELLQKRFPGIKIVPYTEFPRQYTHLSTRELHERVDATVSAAREKGCDAMIIGNGF